MTVLLSVARAMGLGANIGTLVFMVWSVDVESMENMFFTLVKTGGVKFLLQKMFICTIILHQFLSSFLSSSGPAHHQSPPQSSFSAYPPNSAKKLWRGLNATSVLLHINLKG
jgi:hypothetical protein